MSLTATARSIPGTLDREVVVDGKHLVMDARPVRRLSALASGGVS